MCGLCAVCVRPYVRFVCAPMCGLCALCVRFVCALCAAGGVSAGLHQVRVGSVFLNCFRVISFQHCWGVPAVLDVIGTFLRLQHHQARAGPECDQCCLASTHSPMFLAWAGVRSMLPSLESECSWCIFATRNQTGQKVSRVCGGLEPAAFSNRGCL